VNAAGSGLVYSGYIGGASGDTGFGIAVDGAGNAYVSGETGSSEATFPVTGGPDVTFNGGSDGFVAKVNTAGTGLVYCGYIGGSGKDGATGIAVDSAGNAYITGSTASNTTFPVSGGPDLIFNGGGFFGDAFVVKLNPAGSAIVSGSYIGGENDDVGYSIAVDSLGTAYVAGESSSTTSLPLSLVLNPPNGAISGAPGDTIGWGFTLTNPDNTYAAIASADFCGGVLTSPCSTPLGTFTDFIAQFNFTVVGPNGTESAVFNPLNFTGVGSYTIDSAAANGDSFFGQIVHL
jgi:hypothetical protein